MGAERTSNETGLFVRFGSSKAGIGLEVDFPNITVVNDTTIQVLVPLGATSGQVFVFTPSALAGAAVVLDYAKSGPQGWLPDDVTFGPGPVRPGDLRLECSADSPRVRFVERAAAEKDPVWDGLRPVGAERDPGAVGRVTGTRAAVCE